MRVLPKSKGAAIAQVALVCLALAGAAAALQAREHDYPYAFAFQSVRTPILPGEESELASGESAVRLSLAWANVWSIQDERFIVDGEELQSIATYRYGLNDRLQIGLSAAFVWQGGGAMDSFLEGFHRSSGVTQGGRDRFPRNTMNVSYEPYGDLYALFDDDPLRTYLRRSTPRAYPRLPQEAPLPPLQGFPFHDFRDAALVERRQFLAEDTVIAGEERASLAAPRLSIAYRLGGGGDFEGWSIGLAHRFARGGPALLSSVGAATGFWLHGAYRFAQHWRGALGLSWTYFSAQQFRSLQLPEQQWTTRLRLDREFSAFTLFGEYVYFSAPVRGETELARSGHTLAFGLRHEAGDIAYQAGVAENFLNFGVTPDLGLFFSAERRL